MKSSYRRHSSGASEKSLAASSSSATALTTPPSRRCRCTPLVWSYCIEWLFLLAVLVVPLYVAVTYIPFRPRTVSLNDATLAQPYIVKDSLPILFVFLTSVLVPLACFHIYPFLLAKFWWKVGLPKHDHSFRYSYWWSECIIQTVGLTVLLSELSKRLVQAPRPDFIHRCFPSGVPDAVRLQASENFWMFTTDVCEPTSKDVLEDGMQSFPSEHTSLAWCMCSVLILFFVTIRQELLLYSAPKEAGGRLYHRLADRERRNGRVNALGSAPALAQPATPSVSTSIAAPQGAPAAPFEVALHPPNLIGGTDPSQHPAGSPSASPQPAAPAATRAVDNASIPPRRPSESHLDPVSSAPPPAVLPAGASLSGGAAPPPAIVQAQSETLTSHSPPSLPSILSGASFWPTSHVVFIAHVLLPFGWAVAVAFSRTFDHRHHVQDVLAGALLGVGVAYAVYKVHLAKFNVYHRRWQGPETSLLGAGADVAPTADMLGAAKVGGGAPAMRKTLDPEPSRSSTRSSRSSSSVSSPYATRRRTPPPTTTGASKHAHEPAPSPDSYLGQRFSATPAAPVASPGGW